MLEFRENYLNTLRQNAWTDPLIATAAMSSENRSSSAVRNLRSLFENKNSLDSPSPDSRGRSPSGVGGSDKENGHRPRSKVRASFIPVELAGGMATVDDKGSTGMRRGSFSEMDGDGALSDLKRTVSEQQKLRLVPEGAVESTVATPLKLPGEGQLGHDLPADNPDKPVTGEQDAVDMKPADPSSEDAVSGGDALPPVPEDLRPTKTNTKKIDTRKPTTNGKPASISTKGPPKASSSAVRSPAQQPKTPTSVKVSSSSTNAASPSLKAPVKKPSRSSLTAPTAASLARSGAGSDKPPSTKTSPTSKPKPREVTKPVNLSSHLTAPTASSRAKHEPDSEPATSTSRATVTSRPKATTTAKSAPRVSTGQRPASHETSYTSRRSVNPSESSFLDRMTKPTTASVNHRAEKAEAKSPPRSSKPAAHTAKPKVNGAKPASKSATSAPAKYSAPVQEANEHHAEPNEHPVEAKPVLATKSAAEEDAPKAASTPNGAQAEPNLEATPAALGGEETIR